MGFTEDITMSQSWDRMSEVASTQEEVSTTSPKGTGGGVNKGQGINEDGLQPMPVSAVTAGRVPNRSSSIPTGADIMLDAIAEEEVAHQALRFLKQQPGWRPP